MRQTRFENLLWHVGSRMRELEPGDVHDPVLDDIVALGRTVAKHGDILYLRTASVRDATSHLFYIELETLVDLCGGTLPGNYKDRGRCRIHVASQSSTLQVLRNYAAALKVERTATTHELSRGTKYEDYGVIKLLERYKLPWLTPHLFAQRNPAYVHPALTFSVVDT